MLFIIITILGLLIDQGTKLLVVNNMTLGESIPIINKFLHFTYVQNEGAAFSILQGKKIFFVIITVVALAILFYLVKNTPKEKVVWHVVYAFLAAGALGNFIDRIRLSYVVDFIDVRIGAISNFPVFNIADCFLVVGAIMICILVIKDMIKDYKLKK